jgi:hypothetical protein
VAGGDRPRRIGRRERVDRPRFLRDGGPEQCSRAGAWLRLERLRGFSHSFLGPGTITVLTAVSLLPILSVLKLLWLAGVLVVLVGYLGGAVLPLLQDSCTKTGTQWNFPFQDWRVRGPSTTTARPEDTVYQRRFLTVLGVGWPERSSARWW